MNNIRVGDLDMENSNIRFGYVDLIPLYQFLDRETEFGPRALEMARPPKTGNRYWEFCRDRVKHAVKDFTMSGWYAWVSHVRGEPRVVFVGESSAKGTNFSLEALIRWQFRALRPLFVAERFPRDDLLAAVSAQHPERKDLPRTTNYLDWLSQRSGVTAIILMPAPSKIDALDKKDNKNALKHVEKRLIDILEPCANVQTTCQRPSPLTTDQVEDLSQSYASVLNQTIRSLPLLPKDVAERARIGLCPSLCTKSCRMVG